MKRTLYITLGTLCVALGALGVILPGLPTTPFLLAASWLFYRSSPRLQEWLIASHLGAYIRAYEEHGGMHRLTKALVVIFMMALVTCSIIFFIHSAIADWAVGIAGTIGSLIVIFKVPDAR